MAMVSHLHHFFHAETCQSSIHTLRWKDRPLQCLSLSEPQRRSLGHLPRPAGPGTLPLQREGLRAPSMTSRAHSWMAVSAR